MKLNNFGTTPKEKIAKINSMLESEHRMSIPQKPFSRESLRKLKENAELSLVKIKGSSKQFQLRTEYAKFLGIRDIVETMISEGMYAESPAYAQMKEMIMASVQELMDSGYQVEEACTECMNRYRMDQRFAYDDEHIMPIIQQEAQRYFGENSDPFAEPDFGGEDDMMSESKLNEEVEVEQAEVVMALRALADDLQSSVERVGRMLNEDMPAITDQMVAEFGAESAQNTKTQMDQILQTVLDANRTGKDGIDSVIGQLTGSGVDMGLGGDEDFGLGDEAGLDDMQDIGADLDNIPAGDDLDQPLGRGEI